MIKAFIFDLDGTLLDTLADLNASLNHALALGAQPLMAAADTTRYLGNGVSNLVALALKDGQNNPIFTAVLAAFKQHYSQNSCVRTKPYDGILPMLSALKTQGFGLAIASNKFDSAVKELNEKFFKDYISIAIGEGGPIRRKPAPDGILAALNQLNIQPIDAVYVGDSEVDIQTAQNTGIACISVTWGFRQKVFLQQHGAKYFADIPADILKLAGAFND